MTQYVFRIVALSAAALLAGCASTPRPQILIPAVTGITSKPMPLYAQYKASFDCSQSESGLQDTICADDALSTLDRDMAQAYRANLRSVDLVGRMQLIANQRRWSVGRAAQCKVSYARLGSAKPGARQVSCLKTHYNARIAELKAWPQPQAKKGATQKFHPLSAYVEFKPAAGGSGDCATFVKYFNNAVGDIGAVDPSRIAGFTEIAGTNGPANGSADGHRFEVALYDAGPYASYQTRAYSLSIDGSAQISDISLGQWIAGLPNSGGRFGDTSSQTRDYASIDVFKAGQRTYALVAETWGFYSAAALGESSFAGLYDVSSGTAQQQCLFQTYLTPPVANPFGNMPAYKELDAALKIMSGDIVDNLPQDERRDDNLLQRETEWILLNMPLVVLTDADRYGRTGALRQRHDAALEAIFKWSERNVPSKLHYRRLMPLIQPARDEMIRMYQQIQGLKPDEAAAAADLLLIDVIDRAAESLGDAVANTTATAAAPLPPFANYNPRYAAAPMPGDLERGRRMTTLHNALINRAGPDAVADFIKYDFAAPDRAKGRGAAGDTAIMAAVRTPEAIPLLLGAGINANAGNDWKKTPLMTAAQTNQLASAQLLLDAGADINASTVCWFAEGAGGIDNSEGAIAGRTPLMYAATGGDDALVRLLLSRGAKVDQKDAAGRSACNYLADNETLSNDKRASLAANLCPSGSSAWMPANSTTAATIRDGLARPCPSRSKTTFTADEAKQLGGPVLTAWGAEKGGNDDGTIPEYSGSGVAAPPGWNPANPGVRPDPYGEKPVLSITPQNFNQYADKLDGMVEVFRKYPNFRMDVYPSHRDYVFPQRVIDNMAKNLTSCRATDNEQKLEGCFGGLPFPIPETGKQAMWNHLTAFTSFASTGKGGGYYMSSAGTPILIGVTRNLQDFPYYDPARTGPVPSSALYWRSLLTLVEPARWAGTQLMLLNPLDQIGVASRTYFYGKGTMGRAKLSPELAHDTPVPWSGDTQTMDDIRIFNGSLDRYDFKLIGKKEKYISYNNYKITDLAVCPASVILTPSFPNPACLRWELHRVWVVEATLKSGASHIYPKRRFYWDEDGYVAGQAENYGPDGFLHRIVIGAPYPYFEAPGGADSASFSLDLKTSAWYGQGISCADCGDWPLKEKINDKVFSPDGMAAAGIR